MSVALFKLAPSEKREGVSCDANGAFIGSVALLKRANANSAETWGPRNARAISRDLSNWFGLPIDVSSKMAQVKAIARALNAGDLARAQLLTLFLRFPDPSSIAKPNLSRGEVFKFVDDLINGDFVKRGAGTHSRSAVQSGLRGRSQEPLAKYNPNHWPAGAPDNQGGRFAPKGVGDNATSGDTASSSGAASQNSRGTQADRQIADNDRVPSSSGRDSADASRQAADPVVIDQVLAAKFGTTTIKFSQGLTGDQFNSFLAGKLELDAQVVSARGGTITSNEAVSSATALVHPDRGGKDIQASAELSDLMKSIAPALYNYEPNGDRQAEKFVTIGTDANGKYVVTSLQFSAIKARQKPRRLRERLRSLIRMARSESTSSRNTATTIG